MKVPQQIKGNATDNVSVNKFPEVETAKEHFRIVSARLRNINGWKALAGPQTAAFQVYNSDGQPADREVREGDYIRIDIPGPGSSTGDGFDWVTVLSIRAANNKEDDGDTGNENEINTNKTDHGKNESGEDADESLTITVKPSDNPLNRKEDTAHFFESSATSTFIIQRIGTRVQASVHGRNEEPNTRISATIDKMRNTLVAKGAAAGFSGMQWQSLTDGLIGS